MRGRPASPSLRALYGLRLVARSPYLLLISLYMFLYTFTSSFLYFQKAHVVKAAFAGEHAQVAFFARLNLAVGLITVVLQLLVTGRLLAAFGVTPALALVPAVTVCGFMLLGAVPGLLVFACFDVTRKAANYAGRDRARQGVLLAG